MNLTNATRVIIVCVLVGVIVYDLWPALNQHDDDTVSEQIRILTAMRWWCFPFGAAVLAGHFWGPLEAPIFSGAGWVMLAIGLVALALCVFRVVHISNPAYWGHLMLSGYTLGSLLWAVEVSK